MKKNLKYYEKTVNAFKRNIAKNKIKVQFSMHTFKKYGKKKKNRAKLEKSRALCPLGVFILELAKNRNLFYKFRIITR